MQEILFENGMKILNSNNFIPVLSVLVSLSL